MLTGKKANIEICSRRKNSHMEKSARDNFPTRKKIISLI